MSYFGMHPHPPSTRGYLERFVLVSRSMPSITSSPTEERRGRVRMTHELLERPDMGILPPSDLPLNQTEEAAIAAILFKFIEHSLDALLAVARTIVINLRGTSLFLLQPCCPLESLSMMRREREQKSASPACGYTMILSRDRYIPTCRGFIPVLPSIFHYY
jgi:hypothetical protein